MALLNLIITSWISLAKSGMSTAHTPGSTKSSVLAPDFICSFPLSVRIRGDEGGFLAPRETEWPSLS